jgi:hypothetical protein
LRFEAIQRRRSARPALRDPARHLEHRGVAAVGERGDQDAVARLRAVERAREQEARVRGARASDRRRERIGELLGLELERARQPAVARGSVASRITAASSEGCVPASPSARITTS